MTVGTPQEVVEQALAASSADGCVAFVVESTEANLRWANNSLTTNGSMRSRRVVVVSFVDGGAGMAAGTVARTCRLKGARQHLQTPLTSDVRPGPHRTQPPDISSHGQQAVDSYDRRFPTARFTYVCSLACSLSAAGGT